MNLRNKVQNLEAKIININQQLEDKNQIIKENKKKIKQLDVKITPLTESQKKCSDKATDTKTNTGDGSTQTTSKDQKSVGTSPLFSNIPLLGLPNSHVTCFCSCHSGEKCVVQLFKYTDDSEEALDAMYYREDYYDDWSDYDENTENTAEMEETGSILYDGENRNMETG